MFKTYPYLWMALNGLYSLQLPNIAQVYESIETKYLAQGHKHVGASGRVLHCSTEPHALSVSSIYDFWHAIQTNDCGVKVKPSLIKVIK